MRSPERRLATVTAALLGALILTAAPAAALPDVTDPLYDEWNANGKQDRVELAVTDAPLEVYNPGGGGTQTQQTSAGGGEPYVPQPGVDYCAFSGGDGAPLDCAVGADEIVDEADDEEITPEDVQAAIVEAFQSLPVTGQPISYQPEGSWAAVSMDFIVYTDTDHQVFGTTILDVPVEFDLTPRHWTWDFGDGSGPVPSSTPGQAYPNQTVSHVYSSASDGVTLTLTTLWSGQFQVNGAGDWYDVDGFVTTTSTAGPVQIVAFDVNLVPNQGD